MTMSQTIIMNQTNERSFIKKYQDAYFGESKEDIGITVRATPREIEEFIEKKLKAGIIDEYVVAWKAGQLVIDNNNKIRIHEKDGHYLNGYGKAIDKDSLHRYLSSIESKREKILKYINNNDISNAYDDLLKDVPDNFGCVYMINLLYFISERRVPIYDKFAHKAVKGLYVNESPAKIYVGEAPSKKDKKSVMLMYQEYLWLLNRVFGKIIIERPLDRSLWVYGHADEETTRFIIT